MPVGDLPSFALNIAQSVSLVDTCKLSNASISLLKSVITLASNLGSSLKLK